MTADATLQLQTSTEILHENTLRPPCSRLRGLHLEPTLRLRRITLGGPQQQLPRQLTSSSTPRPAARRPGDRRVIVPVGCGAGRVVGTVDPGAGPRIIRFSSTQ